MNKKNTKQSKVDAMLSDSDDEPVVNKKTTTKKTEKRKQSAASDSSHSVNLLKNKTKLNKEEKKPKKQADSDSSDDEPKKPVQKAKVSKKAHDSDSEDEKPKKPVKKVSVEKKKVDSDSEDEKPKKAQPKKKADSDSEDEKPKKAQPKKKADSDSEDEKPKKTQPKKKVDSDDEEVDVPMKNLVKSANNQDDGETHAELFVKNLSYQSTEDSIYEHFGKFGTVTNVKLLTDKMTGRPKGIGFVAFATRSEAKNALENCGEVDGRTPTCSWSNDKSGIPNNNQGGYNNNQGGYNNNQGGFNKGGYGNSRPQQSTFNGTAHTIFVGNLGFRTNEDSVRKFFSKVGNVVGVRIAKHEDGKAKGFCHVDFDAQESAQAAVGLAGQSLDGREIRVDMSEPRKGGAGGQGGRPGGRPGFSNRGPAKPEVGRLGEGQGKKVTFDDDDE